MFSATLPNSGAPIQSEIAAAVAEGDVRVLLMVLVHLTGDRRWLEPPFQPKRDIRLIPDPSAGLPPAVQAEVRAAASRLLAAGQAPVLTDPGNALVQTMVTACLGENVPPEYAPLFREETALIDRVVEWSSHPPAAARASHHVLIVGAGVSGIALGVALDRLGIPYTIVEMAAEVGGTWYANRYPGCGVDTPSHAYSFSFGPRYPWSRYFSPRDEVLDYLRRTAERYGLRRHIRFRTRLTAARWDEKRGRWVATLETPTGREIFESAFLVSAIGQLSDAVMPPIDGLDSFVGTLLHSARWPDALDVEGKRLAVIGTGATAMQLVPALAGKAAAVTVYQRSPQWVRPVAGYSDRIGTGAQWLLQHAPFYAEWVRFNMFWRYGDGLLPCLRKDPDWPFPERAVNRTNDRHRQEMTDFISSELAGRDDLIAKCVPTYPPYGKRILLDNGWYRTLRRPDVELVDTPIRRITPDGILSMDGTLRPADVIVCSTGFRVVEMAARLGIVGRGGVDLREAWAEDNPTAFLGLTVPGFPNFFCMMGPNSGPAHGGSGIFQAECQTRYVTSCLVGMIEKGLHTIDVRRSVHDDYVRKVDAEHEQLIWSHPGMTTYYKNRHGRVFSALPWRFVDYWAMTHDADLGDYETTNA